VSKVDEMLDGIDKVLRDIPKEGNEGELPCPVCKTGTIKWVRVPTNRHLRVGCSTPECIMMIQ